MPKVLNKYTDPPSQNSVNIMRGTKWGNPYVIGPDGDRENVIELHTEYVVSDKEFMEQIKLELKGKDLVCCCAPKACHGDLLLRIANAE
jgi:hypothetical protein